MVIKYMKIIGIKKLKNKYKIILENDNIIETYDEIIIRYNILYKKEINQDLKRTIEDENTFYEIYNDIIKFINKKIRSINEIREYMNRKKISLEIQEKIIEKLKNSNLIDDSIYIKAYVHDKLLFSNYGLNKIREDLYKLGLDGNIIDTEINRFDSKDQKIKLEKMIIKKINNNTKYSSKIIRQKIINYFINLGYNREDIIEILEKNSTDNVEIIKSEYSRIYNKYKVKYEGEQLENFVRQKLFQRGFSINEINNIIK